MEGAMDTMGNTTIDIGIGKQEVSEGLFSGLVALSEMRQLLDELYGGLENSPWQDMNRSDEQAHASSTNKFAGDPNASVSGKYFGYGVG
jgi:hypothetical protein